jgi:endonuclease YncB( thermonuclease family)
MLVPLLFVAGSASAHADIVGVASVIDADTIEIHGQRIRLHGIDAPEGSQTCLDAGGGRWRCGQRAALALQELIGRRSVMCDERDLDQYGRIVGRCLVGGLDINEWLVAQGLALAYRHYSRDYVAAEDRLGRLAAACGRARSSRRGSGGADPDGKSRPAPIELAAIVARR